MSEDVSLDIQCLTDEVIKARMEVIAVADWASGSLQVITRLAPMKVNASLLTN